VVIVYIPVLMDLRSALMQESPRYVTVNDFHISDADGRDAFESFSI
jgi:hypothetical protein